MDLFFFLVKTAKKITLIINLIKKKIFFFNILFFVWASTTRLSKKLSSYDRKYFLTPVIEAQIEIKAI